MLKILFFFNDLVTSRQVKKERRFFKLRRALCVFILKTVGTGRLKKKKSPDLELENRRHDGNWRGDSGPGGHPYPASVR